MPMPGNFIASKGPQSPVIIVWHVTSQGDVLHNKSSARPIHKYSINNAQFIGRGEKGQARNQNNKKIREQDKSAVHISRAIIMHCTTCTLMAQVIPGTAQERQEKNTKKQHSKTPPLPLYPKP
jgi:hypothetical protein